MTKATKATPPPKKDEFLWAAIGVSLVSLVALVACMVSDGCPRQRTSETFPISRTEFKKSFLWQQAQPIVILSMGSQPYGMAVS